MPEVPQNIGQILPMARDQAARVVAHLGFLSHDLRDGSTHRRTEAHADGCISIAGAAEALQALIGAIEAGEPGEKPVREPGGVENAG